MACFGGITVLPVIALISWLAAGLPLLLAGAFYPEPMLLIASPLAAALAVVALHQMPGRWPRGLPGPIRQRTWKSLFAVAGTMAVAAGFTAWQLMLNSPAIIAARTTGASFQTGYWIAQHGGLPITGSLAVFGGAHAAVHLSSIGFFQQGNAVVPAVNAGLPMLLAAGFWTGGVSGGAAVAPVLGGLAILSFGGLVGRLAGQHWAPAGALVLAITLPELYVSRASFSEAAVQVLLFGGLSLMVDALTPARLFPGRRPAGRGLAGRGLAGRGLAGSRIARSQLSGRQLSGRQLAGRQLAGRQLAGRQLAGWWPLVRRPRASGPAGRRLAAAAIPETEGHASDTVILGEGSADGSDSAGGSDSADGRDLAAGQRPETGEMYALDPSEAGLAGKRGSPARFAGGGRAAGHGGRLARLAAGMVARNSRRFLAERWTGWLTPRWVPAALGGLALGLTALLTPGSLVYLLPVIPATVVVAVGRRGIAIAFCVACAIGIGAALASGYVLARPFLDTLSPELELIGFAAWIAAAVTVAAWALLQVPGIRGFTRKALARAPLRWAPEAGGLIVVAAVGVLFARPYLGRVRGPRHGNVADFVAALQRMQHLVVDPGRLYSEDTVYWLIWYIGAPALLLGTFGAALLVRRCVRAMLTWQDPDGAWRSWALPLAMLAGGAAAVLWQPHTVPDQPWASRRLVPMVIPGLTLAAIWACAWLSRRARERGAGLVTAGAVGLFCVGAMLLPAGATAFGIGLAHSGAGGGLRLSAAGLAQRRTGAGQQQAIRGLCSELGRTSAVVIVDRRVAQDFTQVIRGMCGIPVAWALHQPPSGITSVLNSISRAGKQPVLLGATARQLAAYGGQPQQVLSLATTQNPHLLTQSPRGPLPVRYQIWMSRSGAPVGGA